jgi:aspartokinase
VSAMGKTTNKLPEFAEHARRGDRSRQAAVHIDRALGWVSFSQSIRSRRTHAPIG